MKLKAFSVFDVKADTFSAPFFFPATGLAIRAFKASVADKESSLGKYPEDFKLVELGEFDDQSGQLVSKDHASLGFALDYVERDDRQAVLPLKEVARG